MLSAEILPSVGSGWTLPPAISGASASNSSTIVAPCSVRVRQRQESFLSLVVLGPLEAHFPEIILKRVIRLGVGENLQIDDDVHVERARMGWHRRRPGRYQISRHEPSDQIDESFHGPSPRSSVTSTRSQSSRVLLRVTFAGGRLGH